MRHSSLRSPLSANSSALCLVDIDYKHLRPTGDAWITLTDASFSDATLKKFHEGYYIGANEIAAKMDARKNTEFLTRARGGKGREDAANRGVLGSGPSARISGGEKNVCLSGLPENTTADNVKRILKSFKLTSTGEQEVVKLEQCVPLFLGMLNEN